MTQFTPRSGEGGWGAARADLSGNPEMLFGAAIPQGRRLLRFCEPDRRALVLGSAQKMFAFDGPVVRRRSGGSAVIVSPGAMVWVDVVLPAGDPLWDDDVGRAPLWLGRAWAAAVGGVVHTGAMLHTRWSRTWCFAGLGPGEVTIDGRKVVGISQRRTREWALFQCAALLRWDPPIAELADVATGLGGDAASVQAAFMGNLT